MKNHIEMIWDIPRIAFRAVRSNIGGLSGCSMKMLPILFASITFYFPAYAQTNVSGSISGTWTVAGSPYIIEADVDVLAGTTLTIQPGVQVRFNGNYVFNVHGTLTAVGTAADSIKFTRNNPTTASRGKGLSFNNNPSGTSTTISRLAYCIIEEGSNVANAGRGGGLHANNSNLIIEHCTIRNNMAAIGGGLSFIIGSGGSTGPKWTVVVVNSVIKNNTAENYNVNSNGGAGISASNHSDLNSNPTPSTILIANNLIINNADKGQNGNNFEGGGGIQVGRGVSIINNTFYGNTSIRGGAIRFNDDNLAFTYGYKVDVVNNIIYGNSGSTYNDEIYIDLFSSTCKTSVSGLVIENNIIEDAAIKSGSCDATSATLLNQLRAGNFSVDPFFQNTQTNNFRVQGSSPAIDHGNNNFVAADVSDLDSDGNTSEPMPFDITGTNRFIDIASIADAGVGSAPFVDLGAYEMAVLPPDVPVLNPASTVTQNSFSVSWNAVSGATGYLLDVSTDNFSSFVTGYFDKAITATSFNVTGLAPGILYYFRVRASNAGGNSGNSNAESQITIPATPVPNPATNPAQTTFTASWGAVTGTANYLLDVSADDFTTFVTGYNGKSITTTSETVTGLSPAATYKYRVRASNAGGVSGNSNIISQLTIPETPSATSATAISQTGLTANWNAVTGATQYRLDVSLASSFSSFITGYNGAIVTGTAAIISGLSSGTTYYYRIRSENATGQSPNSNVISQITIPAAPAANTASIVAQTSFTANWTSAGGATHYFLDVSKDGFMSFIAGYEGKSVSATAHSVTGLSAATTYQYRVRSANAGGTSGNSNVVSQLTLPGTPVATAASTVTQSGFAANWDAVAGADNYRIDVSDAANFSTLVAGYQNIAVSGTSKSVSGLDAGTEYYYRVRAENATGQSPNSNIILQITVPPTPTANAGTSVAQTTFLAGWQAVTGASHYLLEVSSDNFETFLPGYNGASLIGTSESISGLTPASTYQYRVRAANEGGISPNSNTIRVLTTPATPVATAASAVDQTSFTANWGNVTGAANYRIEVSQFSNFQSMVSGFSNTLVNGTNTTVTGLSGGTTYYYRVRSENSSGLSLYSNAISQITIPPTPTAVTATGAGQTSFTAQWSAVTGSSGYLLDVSDDDFSTFISGYNGKEVTGSNTVVSGLNPATVYKYRVRSSNAAGISPYSNVISQLTIPATPVSKVATSVTQTSFTANWSQVEGAQNYRIDLSTDNFSTFVAGYNGKVVSGTTALVTGLNSGTTYSYRTRSENSSGQSSNSNKISQITIPATTTANGASGVTQTSFIASWEPVAGAAGYRLDVSTDNFATRITGYDSKAITGTSETVTGLIPATTYQFRVRSENDGGIAPNSNVVSQLTISATPDGLIASNRSSSGFTVNWNPVPGATDFLIDISSDNFISFLPGYHDLSIPGPVSYVVTGLSASSTYQYRLRSRNATGISPYSNAPSITTLASEPVAQPSGLQFSNVTTNALTLGFTAAPGNPTGYLILRSASSGTSDSPEDGTEYAAGTVLGASHIVYLGAATSFTDTGLTPENIYYYRIFAYNGASGTYNFLTSSPLTAGRSTLTLEPTSQPSELSFSSVTSNSIDVSFSPASGSPSGYVVIRKAGSPSSDGLTDGTEYVQGNAHESSLIAYVGPLASFTDAGLNPATIYYYSAYSFNGATGTYNYLTVQPLQGSQATHASEPTTQASNIVFSNTTSGSMTVTWTNGAGSEKLLLAKESASISESPIDGQSYTGSPDFTTAADIGNGHKVLYRGVGSSVSISGLSPATTYYFQVFELHGSGEQTNYLTVSNTGNPSSKSTLAVEPGDQPTNLQFSNVTQAGMTLTFTPASTSPAGHIVLRRSGSMSTDAPLDGTEYSIGQGVISSTVAYIGTATTFDDTGLSSGTNYHYAVYSFNGTTGTYNYLTAAPLSGNQVTSQPSAFTISAPVFQSEFSNGAKISIEVSGARGPLQVSLYSRKIAGNDFTTYPTTLKSGSSSTFEITISEEMADELGLEFYFEADDGVGTIKNENPSRFFIYKAINPSANVSVPFSPGFDGKTSTYQMFSIPYELEDKDIDNLFDVALNGQDKSKWRLFHYQANSYREYPNQFKEIKPGEGYWFNTIVQDFQVSLGAGTVTPNNQQDPFEIRLEPGWNQIGNPYPFNVDWSAVIGTNDKLGDLWFYRNGSYTKSNIFKPWTGAFVHADEATTLPFPVTAKTTASGRKSDHHLRPDLDAAEWLLPLTLRIDALQQISGIGMHPDAKTSKDRFDEITIPRFLDYAEMNTYHEEFFSPHFSTDVVPAEHEHVWLFEVKSNLEGARGELSWDASFIASNKSSLMLIDLLDEKWIDMRTTGHYSFTHKPGRQFRIIYNREGEIKPGMTLLGEAYPNPFTSEVRIPLLVDKPGLMEIEIYDAFGRLIQRISADFAKPGMQEITWDTRHVKGQEIRRGLFYYRLPHGGAYNVKRLIKK